MVYIGLIPALAIAGVAATIGHCVLNLAAGVADRDNPRQSIIATVMLVGFAALALAMADLPL